MTTRVLLASLGAVALSPQAAKEIEDWRAEKDREMRGPESPLGYVGARTLSSGHTTVGSGPGDGWRFDVLGVPERALDLVSENGRVGLVPLVALVTINGKPADVNVETTLKPQDLIELGPLQLRFKGGLQVAVSDRSRPAALAYAGLHYLPLDARYRVEATFEPAAKGKQLQLETTQHAVRQLPLMGVLRFSLLGQSLSLEAFQLGERPRDLFVVFRDATSGTQTYGAGRFLWVKEPVDGRAVVDFNQAWNPLCAYSSAYNCPIPPPENRLAIPIPVGEATYAQHP